MQYDALYNCTSEIFRFLNQCHPNKFNLNFKRRKKLKHCLLSHEPLDSGTVEPGGFSESTSWSASPFQRGELEPRQAKMTRFSHCYCIAN